MRNDRVSLLYHKANLHKVLCGSGLKVNTCIKVRPSRCILRIKYTRTFQREACLRLCWNVERCYWRTETRRTARRRWTWIVERVVDAACPVDRCPTLFRRNRTSFADNIAAEKNDPGAESYAVQDPLLRTIDLHFLHAFNFANAIYTLRVSTQIL